MVSTRIPRFSNVEIGPDALALRITRLRPADAGDVAQNLQRLQVFLPISQKIAATPVLDFAGRTSVMFPVQNSVTSCYTSVAALFLEGGKGCS